MLRAFEKGDAKCYETLVLVIARRGGKLPSNWRGAKGGACAARPEANYLVIGRPGVAITN